jgi:hypothetical protein
LVDFQSRPRAFSVGIPSTEIQSVRKELVAEILPLSYSCCYTIYHVHPRVETGGIFVPLFFWGKSNPQRTQADREKLRRVRLVSYNRQLGTDALGGFLCGRCCDETVLAVINLSSAHHDSADASFLLLSSSQSGQENVYLPVVRQTNRDAVATTSTAANKNNTVW